MNSTLKGVLIFVLGAAAGSLATWKLIEKKYKDIAQEEIDSVKDTFSKMKKNEYPEKLEDYPDFEEFDDDAYAKGDKVTFNGKHYISLSDDSDDVEEEPKPEQKIDRNNKPDIVEYAKILSETGYTNYAERQDKKEKKGVEPVEDERPYVISPDEFGEKDGYENVTLTYYADGVLTDYFDNVISNVDEVVGFDSLDHFGEYEDDVVFVRNEKMETDYEILRDLRDFNESDK